VAALRRADELKAEPTLGNRWRCEQRYGLLEARLHLLDGTPQEAREAAERTLVVASERGDERHSTIARLLVARAQARLGPNNIDRAQVESDLSRLLELAGLEAWWLAADVFDDTGLDLARAVVEQSAGRLLEQAGDHAPSLRKAVAARLS
jgi:hypothetical protein